MELTIFWTDFSKAELKNIFNFYTERINNKVAKRIINDISNTPDILRIHPEIGQVEPYLENRKHEFRYLIYTNYKIIYWVNLNEKRIEIVDVFSTKQDPMKMKRIK